MRALRAFAALLLLSRAEVSLTGLPPGRQTLPVLTVAPGEALMKLTLPARGRQPQTHAFLKRMGVNGDVETWVSQDRRSLSLRRGIVVATPRLWL